MYKMKELVVPIKLQQGSRSLVELLKELADYKFFMTSIYEKLTLREKEIVEEDILKKRSITRRFVLQYVKDIEKLCQGFNDIYNFDTHIPKVYDRCLQLGVNNIAVQGWEVSDKTTRITTSDYRIMVMYINRYIELFQEIIDNMFIEEETLIDLKDLVEVFSAISEAYVLNGDF